MSTQFREVIWVGLFFPNLGLREFIENFSTVQILKSLHQKYSQFIYFFLFFQETSNYLTRDNAKQRVDRAVQRTFLVTAVAGWVAGMEVNPTFTQST